MIVAVTSSKHNFVKCTHPYTPSLDNLGASSHACVQLRDTAGLLPLRERQRHLQFLRALNSRQVAPHYNRKVPVTLFRRRFEDDNIVDVAAAIKAVNTDACILSYGHSNTCAWYREHWVLESHPE